MRPDGSLEPRARLAPRVALIVECATAMPMPFESAMRCAEGRRRCRGHLRIVENAEGIDWHCAECGDAGHVHGWRGTRWDLTDADLGTDDEEIPIFIATDELRALRDLDLPTTLRAVLASAVLIDPEHAVVPLAESDLAPLLGGIASTAARGEMLRRLDRAQGRIEQARLAHQLARRARSH